MFAYLNNKMRERCGENSLEEDYSCHKNIGRCYVFDKDLVKRTK